MSTYDVAHDDCTLGQFDLLRLVPGSSLDSGFLRSLANDRQSNTPSLNLENEGLNALVGLGVIVEGELLDVEPRVPDLPAPVIGLLRVKVLEEGFHDRRELQSELDHVR